MQGVGVLRLRGAHCTHVQVVDDGSFIVVDRGFQSISYDGNLLTLVYLRGESKVGKKSVFIGPMVTAQGAVGHALLTEEVQMRSSCEYESA